VVLLIIGAVLGLTIWSHWQHATNGAEDAPGRRLPTRGYVVKVVFRPDGRCMAGGGGIYKGRGNWETGEINIWDPATGQNVLAFAGHAQGVSGLDCSPDGKRLASAAADGVKVWDAANGKQLVALRMKPKEEAWRVVFDTRGQLLATLSWDWGLANNQGMAVRIWHAPPDAEGEHTEPLFTFRFQARFRLFWDMPGLVFSPDGRYLACGPHEKVLLWDMEQIRSPEPVRVLEGHNRNICDLAFSPDGRRLATSADDETIRIWDPTKGQEILSFDSPRDGIPGYRQFQCLAFSPDGRYLAGGKAQYVAIWDTANGQRLHYLGCHSDDTVETLAFSPDGKTLACGTKGHVKLVDLIALEQRQGEKEVRPVPEGK
jgi:WD40 repeat protein